MIIIMDLTILALTLLHLIQMIFYDQMITYSLVIASFLLITRFFFGKK